MPPFFKDGIRDDKKRLTSTQIKLTLSQLSFSIN